MNKREDGFHNLETVFYPLSLQDGLEIIHQTKQNTSEINITGLPVDGNKQDNICIKAYLLLKADFPQLPPVSIHLHKGIPLGAGLGGGSSDGAFTLMLLNKKFNLQLREDQLIQYAIQLGSDCPFFVINKPAYATGRGEQLTPISLNLSSYQLVLVNPKIHVNTGWAFTHIQIPTNRKRIKEVIFYPVEEWKDNLTNDFEPPVFKKYPEIEAIKKALYNEGATYAAMTGSGSSVFALFHKSITPQAHFPPHYFIKIFSDLL